MNSRPSALVLGGTRYFGKRLVQLLLDRSYQVTLANRGSTPDPFESRVERKVIDRNERGSIQTLASGGKWDVVFDQICYSPSEAAFACDVFEGRVGKYVHTSTASVYQTYGCRTEDAFDPFHYPIRMGGPKDFDYGEGKRLAEAVIFQKAPFPVSAMRIPIVLGPDDYTGRLEFHINHIREGKPMVIPNLAAETSFASSSETAEFLLWLAESPITGPLNACAQGRVTIGAILELIEKHLGKKAVVFPTGLEVDATPFVDENSRYLDTGRAQSLGFQFKPLMTWLPGLVDELCEKAGVHS